ncbi:MAG: lysophospholipid acyltransferase family protein [Pirellulales bacterium]
MQIKKRLMLAVIGWLGAAMIRVWLGTLRHTLACADWRLDPWTKQASQICVFWHESLLIAAHANRGRGIHIMISQSRDGEYITRVAERLGYHAIRGSSTRGGMRAVRAMARAAGEARLAITPDGPRGPRHVFQMGAVYLASRTGLPIIPIGLAYSKAWRAKSWDRFVIPCPWSRASGYFGQPLFVPPDLGPEELEAYRRQAEAAMHHAEQRAEQLLHAQPMGEKLGDKEDAEPAQPLAA